MAGEAAATRSGQVDAALRAPLPGQAVLVLQGGGALGAYQAGVYEALHEAGIEPDWVIGTSIGAINGAIIAGNPPHARVDSLQRFWRRVETQLPPAPWRAWGLPDNTFANLQVVAQGVPGLFAPNPAALWGAYAEVGLDRASYYSTERLRDTLAELVDFGRLDAGATRLTVGAVAVRGGEMRYFDSRREALRIEHIMASGALPPAFPAVRIEGEPYWDGGVYSNTPIERVFDENPRRDEVVFAVQLWSPGHDEPASIWQVLARHKDIQYASRAAHHIARQQDLHRLRHVIQALGNRIPPQARQDAEVRRLLGYGCATTMHVVRLLAPRRAGEDHTKDIDFSSAGIRARRDAGRADARRALQSAPWRRETDLLEGVVVHDFSSA